MVPVPLVLKRSQSGQSERSSEISSGVKNTGGIASICLCHRGYGSLVQEHHGQNHANTPNKLAFDEYGAPRFRGEAYADETAGRHQKHSDTDGNANVESADHEGQDRHKHKSRNTHPKYNEPGLNSVIIGYDRKKLGNDVGRDRKSTRLNSSHSCASRMTSSA